MIANYDQYYNAVFCNNSIDMRGNADEVKASWYSTMLAIRHLHNLCDIEIMSGCESEDLESVERQLSQLFWVISCEYDIDMARFDESLYRY